MDSCCELVPAIQANSIIAPANHADKRINHRQHRFLVVLRLQPVDLGILGTALRALGRKQAESFALSHIGAATLNDEVSDGGGQ
jgi:hypothetical protein